MVFTEFFAKTYRVVVSYVELIFGNGSEMQMAAEVEVHRALTIPEIREHILQFCSRKTLKACRLVSKDWRDSSVKALSSKSRIRLDYGIKMSEFLGFVKRSSVNRKLYVNFFLNFSLEHHKTAKKLWRLCGDNVNILELSNMDFCSADDLRAVLFQAVPNMQQLSLQGISVISTPITGSVLEPEEWVEPAAFGQHRHLKSLTVDDKASKNTGISWMEYFSHFSSLEILRMQWDRDIDPNMFRALNRIRNRDPTKLPLKDLRICYRRSASINRTGMNPVDVVTVLLDPGLHLESLVLCVSREIAYGIHGNHAKFSELLGAHQSSLKSLELNCNYLNPFPLFPFSAELDTFPGQFENLSQATFMSTSISSLNFLKFTPNVRQLLIKHDVKRPRSTIIESTDFAGMGNLELTKLEKLELNFDENVTTEDLQLLMNLLPNVKKLKMPLSNDLFELVCQRWQNLETLEIVRGCVDLNGITGLGVGQVAFLDHLNCSPGNAAITRANITCLGHLRTFSMTGVRAREPYSRRQDRSLCHWAAHLGIERLPQLEHLKICNYKPLWNMETLMGTVPVAEAWNWMVRSAPYPVEWKCIEISMKNDLFKKLSLV